MRRRSSGAIRVECLPVKRSNDAEEGTLKEREKRDRCRRDESSGRFDEWVSRYISFRSGGWRREAGPDAEE